MKVVQLNPLKYPDHILQEAMGTYKDVLLIGWDNEGILDVRSTNGLTQASIIYLLESVKHKILNGDYDETT